MNLLKSERGFKYTPHIPGMHGTWATVYESSNAEETCLLLEVCRGESEAHCISMTVEQAETLIEGIYAIIDGHYHKDLTPPTVQA